VSNGEALQPYLGLGIGFYTYDDFRDDAGDELNGVSLNLMGGIQYSVTDRVDLDLGYKYRGISWQEILVGWYRYTVDVRSPVSLVTAGVTVKVF
jgi:opacity protein-like surface antigen